ncbi:succinate dehydrogenase/fumarate reductase iron-sulfur subunit [Sporomusa sp.]|uniref:succinate dehydrogenase/fumarate reductase iron-sulfur subunit n=1 Tax=Sporomusa sp. TaxID=2078658 RepID=UPI002C31DE9E|nr:succinate dehydrogenase/fumarate reductase iron-sulfur subunit [Sporomusa sp.]HWR44106.1 succinate dehydrogenase/fumarate reductase iron-sulfur subunit [Sporomusa sp.]
MRQITYKIERFDGAKSFVQEYTFPHQPGKTILWGLINIKETLDPTLAFTAACRAAVCGACAVRVNGQAFLACETPLDGILDRFGDTLTIGPIQNFKVIRDLVVDWEPKAERLMANSTWLAPKDEFNAKEGCRQNAADFKKINTQAGCILCGACASECSKLSADNKDFLEPFTYSKVWKFVADTRDKSSAERIKAVLDKGLWKCLHCVECSTKCPKGLAPGEDIARLRQLSIKLGYTDNPGARHALAFLQDIEDTGRLNETKLSVRSIGMLGSMTKFPFALRLLRRGKLNPFHFPGKVKGHEQIKAILKAVRESEK